MGKSNFISVFIAAAEPNNALLLPSQFVGGEKRK